MSRVKALLRQTVAAGASDLHIIVGHPPILRIHTILAPVEGEAAVKEDEADAFMRELLTDGQYERLEQQRDLDFSVYLPGGPRFRVNAHFQRGTPALAFRAIPAQVPPLETLNLPDVTVDFANLPQGLVLVTGETGSGKSTTLAAMINHMNGRFRYHVITLEDPVEYSLESRMCTVEQREIGLDVPDFRSIAERSMRPGAPPLQIPLDTASRLIAQLFGMPGRSLTNCSACAAGAQASGRAFRSVRAGRYTAAVCGGLDPMINPLGPSPAAP